MKSAKNEYENQQIFPNRTLQIFLKEMRLALKNKESREQVSNILDDLEHIATNLGFEDQKSALTHHRYLKFIYKTIIFLYISSNTGYPDADCKK